MPAASSTPCVSKEAGRRVCRAGVWPASVVCWPSVAGRRQETGVKNKLFTSTEAKGKSEPADVQQTLKPQKKTREEITTGTGLHQRNHTQRKNTGKEKAYTQHHTKLPQEPHNQSATAAWAPPLAPTVLRPPARAPITPPPPTQAGEPVAAAPPRLRASSPTCSTQPGNHPPHRRGRSPQRPSPHRHRHRHRRPVRHSP